MKIDWPNMGLLTFVVKGKKKTQLVFQKQAELGLFIRPGQRYIPVTDPRVHIVGILKRKWVDENRIVSKISRPIDEKITQFYVSIMCKEGWTHVEDPPKE